MTSFFDFLVACMEHLRLYRIVDPEERAVYVFLGKWHKEVGPGIYPTLPFGLCQVHERNVQKRPITFSEQSLNNKDGKRIAVEGVATAEVHNLATYMLSNDDPEEQLAAHIGGAIAQYILSSSGEDSFNLANIEAHVKNALKNIAKIRWGLEVMDVRIIMLVEHRALRIIGVTPVESA